ncbi:MAG: hypothetical protein Q9168_000804 [Polycauliona sp. 1 TL-2023]
MKRGLLNAQYPAAGVYGQVVNGLFMRTTMTTSSHAQGSRFFVRKARIQDDGQQIAEISISHDDDYAVAVFYPASSHQPERWYLNSKYQPLTGPDHNVSIRLQVICGVK